MAKMYECDISGNCPYDAFTGMDCRNRCGVGVDDSYIPEDEDEITAEDLAEYQGRYK